MFMMTLRTLRALSADRETRMASTIAEKQAEIVGEFAAIADWRDRYRHIIELGRQLPDLPEELRNDNFKVKGCQSQVWLLPSLEDGKVIYRADSDAAIVKGLVAIVLRVFSGHTPDEILASKPDFVDQIGLSEHLSQTRANGLSAMLKQIQMYALAMKAVAARS